MTLYEAIKTLESFNKWRRADDDTEMPDTKRAGEAIDYAIKILKYGGSHNEGYWEKRCLAAEKYIDKSPCDPDITDEQIDAYNEWKEFQSLS